MRKIKVWAVICTEAGLFGGFVSLKDARAWNKSIGKCPAKHLIAPAEITYKLPKKKKR